MDGRQRTARSRTESGVQADSPPPRPTTRNNAGLRRPRASIVLIASHSARREPAPIGRAPYSRLRYGAQALGSSKCPGVLGYAEPEPWSLSAPGTTSASSTNAEVPAVVA